MRGGHQLVRFPSVRNEHTVQSALECLKLSTAQLACCEENPHRLSRLLHASVLDLNAVAGCIEDDPLLAIGVLRMVADDLTDVVPVRTSDCIVLAGRDRLLAIAEPKNFMATIPALNAFIERSRIFSRTASRLAVSSRAVDPAAARLAGLLHYMGEIPVLLVGRTVTEYAPSEIAAWGERLAVSWRFPSALVNAVAARDGRSIGHASDPMRQILAEAHCQMSCQAPAKPPRAACWPDRDPQQTLWIAEAKDSATNQIKQ